MSQAELARALGVTQQTVGAWESGRNIPPTEKLGQLSATLDVSVDHLVLGELSGSAERERIRRLRRALDVLEEAFTEDAPDQPEQS